MIQPKQGSFKKSLKKILERNNPGANSQDEESPGIRSRSVEEIEDKGINLILPLPAHIQDYEEEKSPLNTQ